MAALDFGVHHCCVVLVELQLLGEVVDDFFLLVDEFCLLVAEAENVFDELVKCVDFVCHGCSFLILSSVKQTPNTPELRLRLSELVMPPEAILGSNVKSRGVRGWGPAYAEQ